MEQIVVYQKRLVSGSYVVNEVELFSQSPFRWLTACSWKGSLMADDYVQMTIVSMEYISFCVGDYCIIDGRKFSIRSMADVTRTGEDKYEYNVIMYGAMYELVKRQFRNADTNGASSASTFDLTYDLKGFVQVILNNMNREVAASDKEWFSGNDDDDPDKPDWPDTEPITISFSKNNCLTALQAICNSGNFDTEFRIEQTLSSGKYINTIIVGEPSKTPVNSVAFAWGKGNGLYKLKECKVDDSTLIDRLWVEGGTENVKSSYRNYAQRLQLPLLRKNEYAHTLKDGTTVVVHQQTIGIVDDTKRYIQDNTLVNRYGVLEDTYYAEDIYPSFTGSIYKLHTTTPRLRFYAYIGFNLNDKWAKENTSNFQTDYNEWCYINGYYRDKYEDYNRYVTLHGYTDEYTQYLDEHSLTEEELSFSGWEELIMQGLITPTPPAYEAWEQEVGNAYNMYVALAAKNTTKYLIDSSTPAKVSFVDGKLAGCEFEIEDNFTEVSLTDPTTQVTKTYGLFTLKPFTDETETIFPSEETWQPFRFAVGDKFKLTNIFLPYEYYVKAEEDLWYNAKEQFEEVKQPSYKYELTFDEKFVQDNESIFDSIKVGSYIKVMDERFFLSETNYTLIMRVTSIEYDMLKEYSYKLTLENVHKLRYRASWMWARMINEYDVIQETVPDIGNPNFRKRNGHTSSSLTGMVFNSGNKLRTEIIEDASIAEAKLVSQVVEKLTKAVASYDEIVSARGQSASLLLRLQGIDQSVSSKADAQAMTDALSGKVDNSELTPYVYNLDPTDPEVQQQLAAGEIDISVSTHEKGEVPRVLITLNGTEKEFKDYDIKYESAATKLVFDPAHAQELQLAKVKILK